MLVAQGIFEHGGDMDAAFVGKGTRAHKGLMVVMLQIGDFGHVAGEVGELLQFFGWDTLIPHF